MTKQEMKYEDFIIFPKKCIVVSVDYVHGQSHYCRRIFEGKLLPGEKDNEIMGKILRKIITPYWEDSDADSFYLDVSLAGLVLQGKHLPLWLIGLLHSSQLCFFGLLFLFISPLSNNAHPTRKGGHFD